MTLHGDPTDTRGLTGYDAARMRAAVYDRGERGLLALCGRDAAPFLHNVLTNDIAALTVGEAAYAAYLTPQGRMISDMTVIRREGEVLLEVEPSVSAAVAARLDGSIFAEDVRVHDRSGEMASIAVCGPAAWHAVAPAIGSDAEQRLPPRTHLTSGEGEAATLVLASDALGIPCLHLFGRPERIGSLRAALTASGTPELQHGAWEALRIEAGVPVFGIDMTEETIPLEAGIQERAISMTKGCYVGQEVIVRILHRGQGRVARKLVGLVFEGADVPSRGGALLADGKEAGYVTSAAFSPRLGRAVALAYVPRALAEPGATVELKDSGRTAVVSPFPISPPQP